MESRGRISRGLEKAKKVIFQDRERASKIAFGSFGVFAASLIGAIEAEHQEAPNALKVGLFVISFLSLETGIGILLFNDNTQSRNQIRSTEVSTSYNPPHLPTS